MKIIQNHKITNSLKIDSISKFYVEINSKNEFLDLYEYMKDKDLDSLVIGEGTNLVPPNFFDGIAIKPNFKNISFCNQKNIVSVGSSVNWHYFVCSCIEKNISGFENLSLIPGSVGAAPIQNIGAYGQEVSNLIEKVHCFDLRTGEFHTLDNKECKFSYRNSFFKKSSLIIYSIDFITNHNDELNLEYESIQKYMTHFKVDPKSLTAARVSEIICEIRKNTLPDPKIIPNAGSFFKNTKMNKQDINDKIFSLDKLIIWDLEDGLVKVGAARLIQLIKDQLPANNNVKLYEKHALILVSNSLASQSEIVEYANSIKKLVYDNFNVSLEIEPIIVN